MAIVKWSAHSVKNLKAIRDYIAIDSIFHAQKFIKEIIKRTEKQLLTLPSSGKKIEEFEFSVFKNLRQINFKTYRIIYNFDKELDIVTILAVIHGKQYLNFELINSQ